MKGLCSAEGCSLIARVLVCLPDGSQLEVCVPHWGDVLHQTPGEIQGMRLIQLPDCFVERCRSKAITIVGPVDDSSRPVCQRHLDDLSWVGKPSEAVAAPRDWAHG